MGDVVTVGVGVTTADGDGDGDDDGDTVTDGGVGVTVEDEDIDFPLLPHPIKNIPKRIDNKIILFFILYSFIFYLYSVYG